MTYIDTHLHIGRVWHGYEPLTVDETLAWMDRHQVEQAVLLPLESPESGSYYLLSDTVLAMAAEHPDRFVPFCVIDPRMSVSRPEHDLRVMLLDYLERGAVGFGEVKVGLPITDARVQRLFGLCNEFALPVVLHIDGERLMDDTRLSGLEATLQAFPQARFVGHAPGFWGAISGDFRADQRTGYPTGPVTGGGAVERLLTDYPNLYADLSAGSGHNALMRDLEHGRGFAERCRNKLLFATDLLRQGQDIPQFAMMDALDLSPETHAAIAHGNARRWLGQSTA